MIRLSLCLLDAVIRPARANRTDVRSRPTPSAAVPLIPRQARRTFHTPTDLLAREHPGWRLVTISTEGGQCFAATKSATTVHAYTPEGIRQRIREVEEEPQPDLVRTYIDWQVPT